MKTVFYGFCVVLLGFVLYFTQKGLSGPQTLSTPRASAQNREQVSAVSQETTTQKKKCLCCSKQLSVPQEKAKQRQQEREAWARQMIADYGYEEGMKRITAKSPWLARQLQRLLGREKRLGQTTIASQSDTQ